MRLIEDDRVAQALPATGADESLADSICTGRLIGRAHFSYAGPSGHSGKTLPEFAVIVTCQVSGSFAARCGFPPLRAAQTWLG